ncbi:DUF1801 domain-containing protein [Larkinella rosea]|uniref:DUF1801 domain-containing protein n=1 Tax=Larkinella rosea TaxID=2025312 RepID=A0A3P1BSX3_9BACT|nr:DUF1801 domain-containing protein [Larkinella rosea]RRB04009.1 DUF1801 domain-containing protein [Larkinella rosea]
MLRAAETYFLQKEEPVKSCLLALREIILGYDPTIVETWKYGMPVYCHRQKMLCYLWTHKKHRKPYLGIVDGYKVDHPDLLTGKRARMKIMLFDPEKDLPIETIKTLLGAVLPRPH